MRARRREEKARENAQVVRRLGTNEGKSVMGGAKKKKFKSVNGER
jgi:hypothetical protein